MSDERARLLRNGYLEKQTKTKSHQVRGGLHLYVFEGSWQNVLEFELSSVGNPGYNHGGVGRGDKEPTAAEDSAVEPLSLR